MLKKPPTSPATTAQTTARSLVILPRWLGDVVMAHGLVQALSERDGQAVDVVCSPDLAPLLSCWTAVGRAHVLADTAGSWGWADKRALARHLRPHAYRHAYVLMAKFKAALVPFLAGIPNRHGWWGEARLGVINRFHPNRPQQPMWRRFAALGPDPEAYRGQWQVPPLSAEQAHALGIDQPPQQPVAVLAPGASYGPAKRWPHFAPLARALTERGYRVWVLGSQAEIGMAQDIAQVESSILSLCGRTDLAQTAWLLQQAQVVVSNDSGLMHLAAALDRPTLGLFGSTSPQLTAPPHPQLQVIYRQLECSPCFQRTCPLGHLRCLEQISVEEVLREAMKNRLAPVFH